MDELFRVGRTWNLSYPERTPWERLPEQVRESWRSTFVVYARCPHVSDAFEEASGKSWLALSQEDRDEWVRVFSVYEALGLLERSKALSEKLGCPLHLITGEFDRVRELDKVD